jgi:hypothetical protein
MLLALVNMHKAVACKAAHAQIQQNEGANFSVQNITQIIQRQLHGC